MLMAHRQECGVNIFGVMVLILRGIQLKNVRGMRSFFLIRTENILLH